MKFQFNDGGRAAAGYQGRTGDCVCRAVTIASGRPYQEVYDRLALGNQTQRKGKHKRRKHPEAEGARTASKGIAITRKWFKDYMKELGFVWVATMKIGQGCKVHLTDGELPMGRLVVRVSKHCTSVIDGVVNDTWNPERNIEWLHGDGTKSVQRRCVYGYWKFEGSI